MPRTDAELGTVSLLGNQNTKYEYDYAPDVLEVFENKHPDNDYVVTFDAYEFTSKCLTGDTLIDVARDETKYPSGIPIKNLVGTEGYVFGVDPKTGNPVARKYHDVRLTRKLSPVVKITLDAYKTGGNNRRHETTYLRCTPDHLILVRTHWRAYEWIQAKDLKPGMHLVYSRRSNDTIRDQSTHRVLAEAMFGHSEIQGMCVHHIDGNHFNNSPDNLELETNSQHSSDHRHADYGYEESLDVESRVVSVEYDGLEDVYNMEVDGIENFFANDVIVHNCPKTGQPDFAKMIISYIPDKYMVESKSLKLYLFSFRNRGDFHEDCVNIIMKDLVKLMSPKYLEVRGIFSPRGGISIFPFATYAAEGYEDIEKQRKLDILRDSANRTVRYDAN